LRESLALRREAFGPRHGLVGDTLRLVGEVEAALGHADARETLRQAQSLTRSAYGARHSHTRRAEISLARHEALGGDPGALTRLDALAELDPDNVELRKAGWLARAYAADVRCRAPGERDLAVASFQSLETLVAQAQPEGGALAREIAGLHADCLGRAIRRPAGGRAPPPGRAAAARRANATWQWPASSRGKAWWRRRSRKAARWRARSRACTPTAWAARSAARRSPGLGPVLAAGDAFELGAADRDVALVAADFDLRPLVDRTPVFVHAHGHRGLAAAVADGLDLDQLVGPGQQVLAALEQFAAEVRAQAVAQ